MHSLAIPESTFLKHDTVARVRCPKRTSLPLVYTLPVSVPTHMFLNALSPSACVQGPSDNPVSDQWLPPFVITDDDGTAVGTVEDGDAVVLFNFRADRVVQISKAFEYPDFNVFDRERYPKVSHFMQLSLVRDYCSRLA